MTATALLAEQPSLPGMARNAIEERYRIWRATEAGRIVYAECLARALGRVVMGRRFSVKTLLEVVRWELPVALGKDAAGFRINNNLAAYLARELIEEVPAVADLIEMRRVRE